MDGWKVCSDDFMDNYISAVAVEVFRSSLWCVVCLIRFFDSCIVFVDSIQSLVMESIVIVGF